MRHAIVSYSQDLVIMADKLTIHHSFYIFETVFCLFVFYFGIMIQQ